MDYADRSGLTTSQLERVTITGADDSTDIGWMIALSQEFPMLEWGILVSRRHEGSGRFPSRSWIDRLLSNVAQRTDIQLSTHVCGAWVRQMLVGELNWSELPSVVHYSQRIQINTHAERHMSTVAFADCLKRHAIACDKEPQFIFQWDGVNDHLTFAARDLGINAAALFDLSGGAGILPQSWPQPLRDIPCGYAGGLGPDNVVDNIARIDAVCHRPYWIDMERRVRTVDDAALNQDAVSSVLLQCARRPAAELQA